MAIRRIDDKFHPRNDNPYWNESSFLTCVIPERMITLMFYVWHRPNMNLTSTEVAVWDPSAGNEYDCLWYEIDQHQHLEPGSDMYEFASRNGTIVETLELGKTFRLRYEQPGCSIDAMWDAIAEPVESLPVRGRANPIIDEWLVVDHRAGGLRTGHFQQAARMRGTITLDGETIEFDAPAHRDHTWGPRDLKNPVPRGGWAWAVDTDGHHFCAPAVSPLPSREDPVLDTIDVIDNGGWYVRDGKLGSIVSGERRVPERGADGRPLLEVIDAVDEHGRKLHAEGRPVSWFNWTGFRSYYDWFCTAQWEFDGVTAWGQIHDYVTYNQRRRLLTAIGAQTSAGDVLRGNRPSDLVAGVSTAR